MVLIGPHFGHVGKPSDQRSILNTDYRQTLSVKYTCCLGNICIKLSHSEKSHQYNSSVIKDAP
jgi:hypothetical protein